MKPSSPKSKTIPLDIVGATNFGRYPKISEEQTFNMIISDNFLVPFAGYKKQGTLVNTGEGRGIYTSTIIDRMIVVINNIVYLVDNSLAAVQIATIGTSTGDVFIAENNAGQIALCDKQDIYIYNYRLNSFSAATLDFLPGYVTFQDGYFISVDLNSSQWRLSDPNDGLSWPNDAQHVGELETKPTRCVAALRFPGKGNLLFVFGQTVTEAWYDIGYQLFPYQRSTYFNCDYGCLNAATIATEKNMIVWLAKNEKAGPVIMVSNGSDPQELPNDGINFRLSKLVNPAASYAFMFRQDGHIFYQITFTDPKDNLSLVYDFTTNNFFTLTDEFMNYHIAKRVAFFDDTYFFVSINNGNLYELNSKFTSLDGAEVPRVRVCKNIRMPDSSSFVVNSLTFTMEQGVYNYQYDPQEQIVSPQRVDLSISNNGNEFFSNYVSYELNDPAVYRNRIIFWNLGRTNDFTPQFRFWGMSRVVATNGEATIFQ